MLNFKEYVILEAQTREAYFKNNRLDKHMRIEDLNQIVDADPSSSGDFIGKATMTLVNLYKNDPDKREFIRDIKNISNNVTTFIKNKKNPKYKEYMSTKNIKSISDFKTREDLEEFLKGLGEEEQVASINKIDKLLSKIDPNGYIELYNDEEWFVADVLTREVSVFLGRVICTGGSWCTSSRENSRHFNGYIAQGNLYFLLNKKDIKDSYYLSLAGKEFQDFQNRNQIEDIDKFITNNPKLKPVYNEMKKEHEKQVGNIGYYIEKRLDAFRKNPSVEGLFILKNIRERFKSDIDIRPWIEIIKNSNLDLSKKAFIGTNANGEEKYEELDILNLIIENGDIGIIKWAVERGSKINYETLNYAIETGDVEIVKYIVSLGASLHRRSLDYAIHTGDLEIIKLIISLGAKPNDHMLGYAIKTNDIEIVKYILSLGVKINDYALGYAIETSDLEMVKMLISLGAKPSGYAIENAIKTKNIELINIVKEYVKKVEDAEEYEL